VNLSAAIAAIAWIAAVLWPPSTLQLADASLFTLISVLSITGTVSPPWQP
jgi:hypothetical protein